jgi:hypothetical protein
MRDRTCTKQMGFEARFITEIVMAPWLFEEAKS